VKRGGKDNNPSNASPLAFKSVLRRNQTRPHSPLKAQPLPSVFSSKSYLTTSKRLPEWTEKSNNAHTAFATLRLGCFLVQRDFTWYVESPLLQKFRYLLAPPCWWYSQKAEIGFSSKIHQAVVSAQWHRARLPTIWE